MIKVTCKDGSKPVKREYPCLKMANTGRIVVFTGPNTGYELVGTPGDKPMFLYYSDRWNEAIYRPYPGTIELSNEL